MLGRIAPYKGVARRFRLWITVQGSRPKFSSHGSVSHWMPVRPQPKLPLSISNNLFISSNQLRECYGSGGDGPSPLDFIASNGCHGILPVRRIKGLLAAEPPNPVGTSLQSEYRPHLRNSPAFN
jgi:hypothetical protein